MKKLIATERRIGVEILECLAEIDRRKAYAELRYDGLYTYCVKELGITDSQAYQRIQAMRALRELPELKPMVETGSLSVSAVSKVQTHLRQEKKKARSEEKKPRLWGKSAGGAVANRKIGSVSIHAKPYLARNRPETRRSAGRDLEAKACPRTRRGPCGALDGSKESGRASNRRARDRGASPARPRVARAESTGAESTHRTTRRTLINPGRVSERSGDFFIGRESCERKPCDRNRCRQKRYPLCPRRPKARDLAAR